MHKFHPCFPPGRGLLQWLFQLREPEAAAPADVRQSAAAWLSPHYALLCSGGCVTLLCSWEHLQSNAYITAVIKGFVLTRLSFITELQSAHFNGPSVECTLADSEHKQTPERRAWWIWYKPLFIAKSNLADWNQQFSIQTHQIFVEHFAAYNLQFLLFFMFPVNTDILLCPGSRIFMRRKIISSYSDQHFHWQRILCTAAGAI